MSNPNTKTVVDAFGLLVARQYYNVTTTSKLYFINSHQWMFLWLISIIFIAVRGLDNNHLILGAKHTIFPSWYVMQADGEYCDVFSVNWYRYDILSSFSLFTSSPSIPFFFIFFFCLSTYYAIDALWKMIETSHGLKTMLVLLWLVSFLLEERYKFFCVPDIWFFTIYLFTYF